MSAKPKRAAVLLTDAFGGRGGIAEFNRNLCRALCSSDDLQEVVALPRLVPDDPGSLPAGLSYRTQAAKSTAAFLRGTAKMMLDLTDRYSLTLCGHINLLPLAWAIASSKRTPLILVIHGIDAWEPNARRSVNGLAHRPDLVVSVSDYTRKRFEGWSHVAPGRSLVIPNCVNLDRFSPGPKAAYLSARHGLDGQKVLLTVSRLSSQERYKGHDEVLDSLPQLLRSFGELTYLIVGDGDDRPRLEAKAARLGLAQRVVFAGYVPEHEKVDYYRAADAFLMPGRGEGFGIAYLEAQACGVPVVASTADASREAVVGAGVAIDPGDPKALVDAVGFCLAHTDRRPPTDLSKFSVEQFTKRWHDAIHRVMTRN